MTCDAFMQLQAHLLYNIIIFFKAVLCSAGAISVVIQAHRRGVSWLVHANSQILFAHYYGILAFQGAVYGLIYIFEFTRLRFPCWEFDFRIILSIRTAGIAAVVASHYIMVAVSIERLYSSLRPLQFEQCSRRIFGIFISWAIIAIIFVVFFYAITDEFRLFSHVRHVSNLNIRIPDNRAAYDKVFAAMTYTFIPSSFIFALDYWLNRRNSQTNPENLSISYQFSENKKVLVVLLPLEVTNVIVTIFATVAQAIFNSLFPLASDIERALLVECTALSTLFPLAFSAIIEWRVRFRKEHTIEQLQPQDVTQSYFSALAADWDKKEIETVKRNRFVKIAALFKKA